MATQFHLTDAGRLALLDAENLQVRLNLTHIAFGSGKYNSGFAEKTALVNEIARHRLTGGQVVAETQTLMLVAEVLAQQTASIYEIGVFTADNVLFAVASVTTTDPILALVSQVTSLITFNLSFVNVGLDNLVIDLNGNTTIATALMNQHLGHEDPHPQYTQALNRHIQDDNAHPQYLLNDDFIRFRNAFADGIWPVDSWHGNDKNSYDPSLALEFIFGYRTVWRLRPYAPYGVSSLAESILNMTSFATTATGTNRLSTTRIWKRMPDDFTDPDLQLSANVTAIDEGNTLNFQLVSNNIQVGERIAWAITGTVSAEDMSPPALFGEFVIPQSGIVNYPILIKNDAKTEGAEYLRMELIDYPGIRVSVDINDTSINVVHPANNVDLGTAYNPGNYQITIQPGEYKRIVLIGGGGGGGAARARENSTAYPLSNGQTGEKTSISIENTVIASANGGGGGSQGEWNNGSAYKDGVGGSAGQVVVSDVHSIRTLVGRVGSALMHNQNGGAAVYPSHVNGQGGDGQAGVGSSGGITGYGYSGGGGSGAAIDLVYFNSGSSVITMNLIVGSGGAGGQKGSEEMDKVGSPGEHGIAYVGTLAQI